MHMKTERPRASIHVGEPAKSMTAAEGSEPERRGWDEKMYRQKMTDDNNHYDYTRKHLNFEINDKGEIVPLGSNPTPLHERVKARLDALGFKAYKSKGHGDTEADNSPTGTVTIIVSGDHDVMARLVFAATGGCSVPSSGGGGNDNSRLRWDGKTEDDFKDAARWQTGQGTRRRR